MHHMYVRRKLLLEDHNHDHLKKTMIEVPFIVTSHWNLNAFSKTEFFISGGGVGVGNGAGRGGGYSKKNWLYALAYKASAHNQFS